MALAKNTGYHNIFFDVALDGVRDILVSEFNYGKIYIAPTILHQEPFSIRIWGDSAETSQLTNSSWQKQYNITIFLYLIEANPGEEFYNQFYSDSEKIYQLLFNNTVKTISVSGTDYTWIDGTPEDISYNNFEGEEEEVEGLNVASITFNCKIFRED